MTTLAAFLALASGCVAADSDELEIGAGDQTKTSDDKSDSSAVAVFVDLEFDGELLSWSGSGTRKKIESQLLYTVGQLNGERSVGRLDRLQLTNIRTSAGPNGKTRIRYHAVLPVAWGDRSHVPSTYTLHLPVDGTNTARERFKTTYGPTCTDEPSHVTSGNMWYHYRPLIGGCELADADVVVAEAAVSVSDINTTGKFPEYHQVWKDDALKVVAVFGKYENGATGADDAGIAAYNRFLTEIAGALRGHELTTEPAELPPSPGVSIPDVTFRATLSGGRTVEVVAILIDEVRSAPRSFDRRYEALTPTADLIMYNGHAGLGTNIAALADKGRWVTGQYAIVFMNGCDTYAYIDDSLNQAHAAVNSDDPEGTKYLDMVTNAMPSYFVSMPYASMALIRGLMAYDAPQTFEQMFARVDRSQVVLVSGEQDNVYVPGFEDDGPVVSDWPGMTETLAVAEDEERRFATPRLAAGRYAFALSGTADADLYVRIGDEPGLWSYDCRPFKTGSDELCVVDLSSPSVIHLMVRGWASFSQVTLTADRQ